MSALPKPPSLDEFIAWEERQELRYEYDGVSISAKMGAAIGHARIQSNLMAALALRLRGGPSFAIGGLVKIRTGTSIRYPDAMVLCSPTPSHATATSTPRVVFEIASASSGPIDLGVKNTEYQTLDSLRRYVVLHQNAVAAEVFFRDEADEWTHELVAAHGVLKMPEIGVELALGDCYDGVL